MTWNHIELFKKLNCIGYGGLYMEKFRKRLLDRKPVFGFCVDSFCKPLIAKLYKNAGVDFVYLENEHSFYGNADMNDFILTCRTLDLPVVVKTPYLDRGVITKLLDAGAIGMQLPMTETRQQVETLYNYIKFPPEGVRATGHDFGNSGYQEIEDYGKWLDRSNRATVSIAHVETARALENIDSILDNGYVDVMFIGAFDLSVSLGYPGKMDHPQVMKAIKRLGDAAARYNKVSGLYVPTRELAEYWLNEGFTFFEIASEVDFILNGSRALMEELRKIPGVSAGL
jgi:4-hydroxy-2-oxoheptanedioate aldolase